MAQPAQSPATQSEVGQDGGGHTAFPPFDASTFPSQLLWLAISFGLLYAVMAKMALPAIGGAILERKTRIAKDIDEATAMQQKAAAAAHAHQKSLDEARARAQGLAQATRDQLTAEADAKRRAVDADLAAKFVDAERQIAATRAQAMSSVHAIGRDAAGAIVERLIGRAARPEALDSAVAAQKPGSSGEA
jgi:F-type H+-transporting ATPase subunit b